MSLCPSQGLLLFRSTREALWNITWPGIRNCCISEHFFFCLLKLCQQQNHRSQGPRFCPDQHSWGNLSSLYLRSTYTRTTAAHQVLCMKKQMYIKKKSFNASRFPQIVVPVCVCAGQVVGMTKQGLVTATLPMCFFFNRQITCTIGRHVMHF